MSYVEKIDFNALKESAKILNEAKLDDTKPLIEKKLKTTAIKKEDLLKDFVAAVNSIDDANIAKLPDAPYKMYQQIFELAEAEKKEAEAAAAAGPADAGQPTGEKKEGEGEPAPEKKGKKEKKAKEPKPPKEKKERKPPTPPERPKNKYGHVLETQADKIDKALEEGGTLEELGKKTETNSGRVLRHVKHLRNDKKIEVEETVTKVGEGEAAKDIKSFKIKAPVAAA